MEENKNNWYENEKYEYFYDPMKYPHPSLTTDCVVFGINNKKLSVLLIKRGADVHIDEWALPGGFIRIKESAEDGVLRELQEETNLVIDKNDIVQFHTYSKPERDPRERVITIAYYALVNMSDVEGGDDAKEARWFPVDNVPKLAFDHDTIFQDALTALRRRIYFEPDVFKLLPEKFTMTQAQRLYETILDVKFDRRNFSSKITRVGVVTELNERITLKNKLEAGLYSFNRDKYDELKRNTSGVKFEF